MVSQAIDIGARMNAKFTLLTHFSQRYMKIPYFKSELSDQVGIAFDNMRVSGIDSQQNVCHIRQRVAQELKKTTFRPGTLNLSVLQTPVYHLQIL